MKSRFNAATWGQFSFSYQAGLEDCEVEGNCCLVGAYLFNTRLVLGTVKSKVIVAVCGLYFQILGWLGGLKSRVIAVVWGLFVKNTRQVGGL